MGKNERNQSAFWLRCRRARAGITLVEVLVAVLVVAIGFSATLSLLIIDSVANDFEQERARAHQMVCEELELVKRTLYTRITGGNNVTVWDNGTPGVATDDTVGVIKVVVRDPKTHTLLTAAPVPAIRVQIEVTLTWHPRGRFGGKTMYETAMTYIAP